MQSLPVRVERQVSCEYTDTGSLYCVQVQCTTVLLGLSDLQRTSEKLYNYSSPVLSVVRCLSVLIVAGHDKAHRYLGSNVHCTTDIRSSLQTCMY